MFILISLILGMVLVVEEVIVVVIFLEIEGISIQIMGLLLLMVVGMIMMVGETVTEALNGKLWLKSMLFFNIFTTTISPF
jgi:hypothetical protein